MKKYKKIIDQTDKQYAFIDESGSYGFEFDKSGVSSHFIITAIIVSESELLELESAVERIRKKYFQTGEMKSSGIGKNHKRRLKILSDLHKLNYFYFSVIIDKRKIYKDSGLMYKQPFIKYLNSMLHNKLKESFPKLQLVSDAHGNKEFMDGFVKYVNKRNQPNLFEEYEFGFDNSKENVLIQLADLIAGTLSYKYEEGKDNSVYSKFGKYINGRALDLVEWPFSYENYIHEYEKLNSNRFDSVIYGNSIRLAVNYIQNNEMSKSNDLKERTIVLKYFLTMLLVKEDSRYVSSNELINNLKRLTMRECSRHYFKTKIIAKLRDDGILISSSNRGYKIPESANDIYSFVNQTNSMIRPMISRLSKARNRVLIATKNELDILDKDEYKILKDILDR